MDKKFINEAIDKLIQDEYKFKVTCIAIIDMMNSDEDLKEELSFYCRISEAIINKEENISEDEKEHFLVMHCSAIQVYNEIYKY